jgi:hypothetical protein
MKFFANALVLIGAISLTGGTDLVISTAGSPSTVRAPLGLFISVIAAALLTTGILIHRHLTRSGESRLPSVLIFIGAILLTAGTDLVISAPRTILAAWAVRASMLGVALLTTGIAIQQRLRYGDRPRFPDGLIFVGAILLALGTDLVISTAGVPMLSTLGGPLGVIASMVGAGLLTTGILMHYRLPRPSP